MLGLGVAFLLIEHVVKERSGARRLLGQRESKLGAIQWSSLSLQRAITTVHGTGRRTIAVLSDPNCPFAAALKRTWRSWMTSRFMFRRVEPLAAPDGDTPIVELMEFGQRIGARGTPTWFLESGARFTGGASAKPLTRLLDEAPVAAGEAGRRS